MVSKLFSRACGDYQFISNELTGVTATLSVLYKLELDGQWYVASFKDRE
jgi:hypothetical protein